MKLTNNQLDKIIETADKIYDSIETQSGNYDLYHDICSGEAYTMYGITDAEYSPEVIDARCGELAFQEMDRRVI